MTPVAGSGAPSVLAVVVSYNNHHDLVGCVSSLAQSGVDEIVVYDNASPNVEVREVLNTIEEQWDRSTRPHLTVVFASENIGFGPALNGVTAGRTEFDFFWFVNPDVVAAPDTASSVAAAMLEHDLAIASPVVMTGAEADTVWFAGGLLHREAGLSEHVVRIAPDADGLVDSTFVTGAAMMIRASTWFELGGFREDLFLYWEDAELCARAVDRGERLAVVANASVWHRVGASGSHVGMSREFHFYMNRNRLIVCGRYAPRWSILIGGGLRTTSRMVRAATREELQPWTKLRACIRGVAEGIRY